jgi:Ca2+-transporting ATPase
VGPQARKVAWHTLSVERVLQAEQVDPRHGLSSAEAASRAQRFGSNELPEGEAEPRWHAFVRQYRDPLQIGLLAAGIGSLYPLKQLGTGLLLILLTLANAVIGLQQEGKAAAAVAALKKMMIIKARVTRDGQLAEIPTEQLVPGDIVSIEAGDVVPADGRLVTAVTLELAESTLTGESLPVTKSTDAVEGADTPLGDRADMVYMHTNVTRGTGEFVVTATGMATEVGRISGMLQAEEAAKTPLTRQLDQLSRQILLIAVIAIGASVGLNLGHSDHEAAAINGNPGRDLGDQHRQDRHAYAQPDDRRSDGGSRATVRRRWGGLLEPGTHHPGGWRVVDSTGPDPDADGPCLRRGHQRRRADR